MDPHTTQKKGRSCAECHQDPRALGLGLGTISLGEKGWQFTSAMSPRQPLLKIDHALDSFVSINGTPLVHTSREYLRPFNQKELERILYVGICLSCHKDLNDPIMRSWIYGEKPAPCKFAITFFNN